MPQKSSLVSERFAQIRRQAENLVGKGNLSTDPLDCIAFASDATEHRVHPSLAVIFVSDSGVLRELVALLSQHNIPMIPYGKGSGYNMGVVPFAPAVTIRIDGIRHLSEIRASRRDPRKYEITCGAGLAWDELLKRVLEQGFVLRCNPNSPRAAVGGICGTGSNGGKRIFEIVLQGRAITSHGVDVSFSPTEGEAAIIAREPFLLARKFFGCNSLTAPLDPSVPVPLTAFIGAEGTTGLIYEVVLELEKPQPYLAGLRLDFDSPDALVAAVRAIKSDPISNQISYFEYISGASIRTYLLEEFPKTFSPGLSGALFIGCEGEQAGDLVRCVERMIVLSNDAVRIVRTNVENPSSGTPEFDELILPRELLPKKLKTKCKGDLEVGLNVFAHAMSYFEALSRQPSEMKDIIFGHLTPSASVILHWNIGGVDLSCVEQAERAWARFGAAAGALAESTDSESMSIALSGEHGLAGKSRKFWWPQLSDEERARLIRIKEIFDPAYLFNPEKLIFRNDGSSSPEPHVPSHLYEIGKKCTKCNACKCCPIVEADEILATERKLATTQRFLSKREWISLLELSSIGGNSLADSAMNLKQIGRLSKCLRCGRCNETCAVSISVEQVHADVEKCLDVSFERIVVNLISTRIFRLVFLTPWLRILLFWLAIVPGNIGRKVASSISTRLPKVLRPFAIYCFAPQLNLRWLPKKSLANRRTVADGSPRHHNQIVGIRFRCWLQVILRERIPHYKDWKRRFCLLCKNGNKTNHLSKLFYFPPAPPVANSLRPCLRSYDCPIRLF